MTADDADRFVELEAIEPLPFEEALSIIGEGTRARIVLELGEARTTDPTMPSSLGFSELMERVDVEDSGRFNYHLDKLVGTFVKKDEDGYALRLPGQLLYEAIVGGTLTERQRIDPFTVGPCPRCDVDLTAAYHPDHLLTIECTDCETLYDAMHFPARGLDGRSRTELLDVAFQRRHHKIAVLCRGVCHACGGVVDRGLEPSASITYGSGPVEEMAGLETYAVLTCRECNTSLVGHPANVALATPTLVGFFADHDRDVALERWWGDAIADARNGTETVAEDPRRVSIPFAIDGDCLRVVLDADLTVVESERRADGASVE